MKKFTQLLLVITILVIFTLALPTGVRAAPLTDDRTVIGETYTLESGRILDGNLNVIGGVVTIKEGATVNGNLFVLGGLVTIDGTINGDLTAVGGTVNLNASAVIEGDLNSPASYININPTAHILGERTESWSLPGMGIEPFVNVRPQFFRPRTFTVLSILTQIGKTLGTALLMVALGALLLLIMPKSAERMTRALLSSPWELLGYGALTGLVLLVGGIIFTITICLIPLVILIGLAFAMAVLVGWLALGYELGKRIASGIFRTTWHPVLAAALGNLVLYLVAKGLNLIPCVGWFPVFITALFGLGMAVTTLLGTYPYPRIGSDDADIDPVVLFQKEQSDKAQQTTVDQPFDLDIIQDTPPQAPPLQPEVPVEEVVLKPEVPIEELNLGTQVNKTLKDAGLTTIQDVLNQLERGDDALLEISGFGEKSLGDLKAALLRLGYDLSQK
ncbi:MAG: polymer-forming cytoskeletal protein [Brevefilum sp.]|nr:polymer-forming cytoskeletal protein [Brevefilum sp.]